MTWFRVDDGWRNNPKVSSLSMAARGLWVTCGNYCAEQLTDGHITRKQVRKEGGTDRQIRDLLSNRMWIRCELHRDCIVFHDWMDHQPSRNSVLARRAEATERKRRSRERKQADQQKPENVTESVTPPVTPVVTQDSHARPRIPTRPDPTRPTYRELRGEGDYQHAGEAPPPKCPTHLADPNPPNCRACGDARHHLETWQAHQADLANQRRRTNLEAHAANERAAINECDMCDHHGYRAGRVCDHDPQADERNARGIHACREALAKPDNDHDEDTPK